jgi:hypothetical protein
MESSRILVRMKYIRCLLISLMNSVPGVMQFESNTCQWHGKHT